MNFLCTVFFLWLPLRALRSLAFLAALSVRFLCLSSFQTPLAVSSLFPVLAAPPPEARLSFCIYTGLHASASDAYSRPRSPPRRFGLLLPLFVQSIAQGHRFTGHMTFFSQPTVSKKMKTEKSLVSQGFAALFTNSFCPPFILFQRILTPPQHLILPALWRGLPNSFCPITHIKRQLPAHADSCLFCKTRMNSYLRFITSLTFSMMWRPISLEASTVCAPMWGLMTKLSQEKSGLWNSSLPLRPLPASSFSITSAA